MSKAYLSPESIGIYLAKEALQNAPSSEFKEVAVPAILQNLYTSDIALSNYIGEKISQQEHACQAAKAASLCHADEDTVLAALFHDIGHLLHHPQIQHMTGNLGVSDHEKIGAAFLREMGFSTKTCELVRRHVDAKRYLTFKNPSYELSAASRGTLLQQGGPMTPTEAKQFENDVLFETILNMRRWDEEAKVVDMPNLLLIDQYVSMMVRALHREEYDAKGFVILRNALNSDMKRQVVEWATEIQNWDPTEKGKWMIYYEMVNGKETLCRTENILPFHEGMRKLLSEGELKRIMDDLLGLESALFKEKINYKLPGGGGFPPHQDAPAFASFGQQHHLTVNVALDDATPENGCLEVAIGQHRRGLFPQNPLHGGLTDEEESKLEWTSVPLKAGEVLVFSSWIPHRSGSNKTSKQRRALYVTYNAKHEGDYRERYYHEKRQVFPPKNEREEGKDYSAGAKTYNLATPITN